jgi:hypothetical protein
MISGLADGSLAILQVLYKRGEEVSLPEEEKTENGLWKCRETLMLTLDRSLC